MALLISTISLSQVLSWNGVHQKSNTSTLSLTQSLSQIGTRNKSQANSLTLSQTATCVVSNRLVGINHLTFGQSLSSGRSRGTFNGLAFSQTLCITGIRKRQTTNSLILSQYMSVLANGIDDPRNNPTPIVISTPVTVTFGPQNVTVTGKTSLTIGQTIVTTGGSIYDYSCSPPLLISDRPYSDVGWSSLGDWSTLRDVDWAGLGLNFDSGWTQMSDSEWSSLSSSDWQQLGGQIISANPELNFAGVASPAWRSLYANQPRGDIDGIHINQTLSYTKT